MPSLTYRCQYKPRPRPRRFVWTVTGGAALTASPADTLTISDALAISQGQAVADTVALTDSLSRTKTNARTLTDSIVLADARAYARGLLRTDTITLSDLDVEGTGKGVTIYDHVGGSDYGEGDYGENPYGQGGAIGDAQTFTRGKSLADTVALTDSFSRAVVYARSVADSVALTDARTILSGRGVTIADTVIVSDSFSRLATYKRTPAETLALTDLLNVARGIVLGDSVALADAQDIFNGIITLLFDPVYTGHIGRGWTGSTAQEDNGDVTSVGFDDAGNIARGVKGDVALVGGGPNEEDDQE